MQVGSKLAGRDMNELFHGVDPTAATAAHSRPSSSCDEHSTSQLKQAIDEDNAGAVRQLISTGADLEMAIGPEGQSALLWAKDANKENAQRVITEHFYKELREKREAQAKHTRRGGVVIEAAMRRVDKEPDVNTRAKAELQLWEKVGKDCITIAALLASGRAHSQCPHHAPWGGGGGGGGKPSRGTKGVSNLGWGKNPTNITRERRGEASFDFFPNNL
eukprot:SAG31_NODE_3963_length_3716_cov_3.038430_1_plen_217_part_10